MNHTIDSLDREILTLLRQNARLSFAEIGRMVKLSQPAVAQRVQKMEDIGLISGYHAAINPAIDGIDLMAWISLKARDDRYRAFKAELHKYPEIQECFQVTGEDCLILKVYLKNNAALDTFLEGLSRYGNTRTAIIINDLSDLLSK